MALTADLREEILRQASLARAFGVAVDELSPAAIAARYLRNRVTETPGLLYAGHYPWRQPATARGVRRSALHEHIKARGAVFGETAGWERANWFAEPGQEAVYRYGWQRPNWFDNQRAEHMAPRTGVGLLDMSSFGKIRVRVMLVKDDLRSGLTPG